MSDNDISNRKTSNRMTIYEKARILGLRATQLSNNAPPYVSTDGLTDCLAIAEKEFEEKKIPFVVRRTLPDGTFEDWSLDELNFYDNDF